MNILLERVFEGREVVSGRQITVDERPSLGNNESKVF